MSEVYGDGVYFKAKHKLVSSFYVYDLKPEVGPMML